MTEGSNLTGEFWTEGRHSREHEYPFGYRSVSKRLQLWFWHSAFSKQCAHTKSHGGSKGTVCQVLGHLPEHLQKHPDKTFIGWIEKGFDFLGYRFRLGRLEVAQKTIEHFVVRAIRLSEQEPGELCASTRLGVYVQRWVKWVGAGANEINSDPLSP